MANIYADFVNGNDTTGNGSAGTPYKTLTRALNAKANGDTILLYPGTYSTEPIAPTSAGNGFVVDVPDLTIAPVFDNGSYGVTVRKDPARADNRVINYVPTVDAAVGGGLKIGPINLHGGNKTIIAPGTSATVYYRITLDRTVLQQDSAPSMGGILYACKRLDVSLLHIKAALAGNSYGIVGSTAAAQGGSVLGTDLAGALYEGRLLIDGGEFDMPSLLAPCPPINWAGFPSAAGAVRAAIRRARVAQRTSGSWAVRLQAAKCEIEGNEFIGGLYLRNANGKAGFAANSRISRNKIIKPWSAAHAILVGEDVQYLLGNVDTYNDVEVLANEIYDANAIGMISHGVHIDQNRRGIVAGNIVFDGGIAFASKEQAEGAQFLQNHAVNCHAGSSGVYRTKGSEGVRFVENVDYAGAPVAAADIGVRMMSNATDVWATAERSGALSTNIQWRSHKVISRTLQPAQVVSIGGSGDASTATFADNVFDLPAAAMSNGTLMRYQTNVYSGTTWPTVAPTDRFENPELYDPNIVRRLGLPLGGYVGAELLAAAARRVA